MNFHHGTETGGKPKFISILLIFFTLVGLDKLKLLQKGYFSYSETEMTEKKSHKKILPH